MKKLEKEIKVLDVDENEIVKKMEEFGAIKIEEGIQKIYVYDLQSIYSRFIDCINQFRNQKSKNQFKVYRKKLEMVFDEIDNLMTNDEHKILLDKYNKKSLKEILNITEDKKIINVFENNEILNIIKRYEINPNKWIRLRCTNNKTTLTVKNILNSTINSLNNKEMQKVEETEMEVPSLEECNILLEQLGFSFRNYQEKKRIKYELDGVEIDIDTWPLIPTYVEIENDSEELIQKILKKLELSEKETVSCNTVAVYNKYGLDVYQYRELKFNNR